MKKTLLLIAACVPLAGFTALEARRSLDLARLPAVQPGSRAAEADPAARQAAEEAQARAQAVLDLAEPVTRAAVLLADTGLDPGDAPAPRALAEPIVAHARFLEELRAAIEKLRQKAETLGEQITAEFRGLPEPADRPEFVARLDQLDAQIEAYERLELSQPGLVEPIKAELKWLRVKKDLPRTALDPILAQLERWKPGTGTGTAGLLEGLRSLQGRIAALEGYLADFQGSKLDQVAEARKQLAEWKQVEGLVRVVTAREPATRLEQLEAIGRLVPADDATVSPRLRLAARNLANVLCADYLKTDGLDPVVLVPGDKGPPEPILRDKISIRWNFGKTDKLTGSGYDEFTLTRDQVEYLQIGKYETRPLARDPEVPPLMPTPYSRAIHEYKIHCSKVKDWTADELRRLKDLCEDHREPLTRGAPGLAPPRLLERIDALLDLAGRNPKLFVASAP
jgi:hypothetical protein